MAIGSRVRARDFRSGSQIGATDRISRWQNTPVSTQPHLPRVRVGVWIACQGERFSFRFADRGHGSHQSLAEHASLNSTSCPGSGLGSGSRGQGERFSFRSAHRGHGSHQSLAEHASLNSTSCPGSGLGSGSRVRARDFRSGSQIGATDRIRDTSLAPICERQAAGGPSSGHPRSGCLSWAKRSVLTREPGPNPDPTKKGQPPRVSPSLQGSAMEGEAITRRRTSRSRLDESVVTLPDSVPRWFSRWKN